MQTYSVSQSLPVLVRNSTENNPLPALSPTDMPPSSSIDMSSSPITSCTFSKPQTISSASSEAHTQVPQPLINTHTMITRAKAGIHKPKIVLTQYGEMEPTSVKIALQCPQWLAAMKEEYKAFQTNITWHLIPQPSNKKIICANGYSK